MPGSPSRRRCLSTPTTAFQAHSFSRAASPSPASYPGHSTSTPSKTQPHPAASSPPAPRNANSTEKKQHLRSQPRWQTPSADSAYLPTQLRPDTGAGRVERGPQHGLVASGDQRHSGRVDEVSAVAEGGQRRVTAGPDVQPQVGEG